MADSISILPDEARVRVFQCPACKETIALGCERCRFCSTAIDQQAANVAADLMDRVNLACSEADEIRSLFSRVPADADDLQAGSRGSEYYAFPLRLISWWMRFGSLKFEDEDFLKARRDMTRYAWITTGVIVVGLVSLAFACFHRGH